MIGSPLPLNLNPYLNCLRIEGLPKYAKHGDISLYFNQTIGVNPKQPQPFYTFFKQPLLNFI